MPSGCAGGRSEERQRVRQDRRRVVRSPEDGDDRHENEQHEVDERGERETVAPQAAEAVTPEADLGARDGAAGIFLFEDGFDCSHQYLILGSTTVYSRSTTRLAMPMSSAYTVNTATVTL